MISENDLKELETMDLYEKISRVESRVQETKNPKPLELGILLALKMAVEIREAKALGSVSGALVSEWAKLYPESVVEEAISHAKELFLNSTTLVDKIRENIITDLKDAKEDDKS
ncbi:MAG: hypothetical protein GX116_07365 [Fibrobacter sp.]|jgi:hypothetical protein|nr:hypothetical protein [Fibrobacter sp.]